MRGKVYRRYSDMTHYILFTPLSSHTGDHGTFLDCMILCDNRDSSRAGGLMVVNEFELRELDELDLETLLKRYDE